MAEVPDDAESVATLEQGDARFEMFTVDSCDYLRITNLEDSAVAVSESCGLRLPRSSSRCLVSDDGDVAPDGTVPCRSQVQDVAIWGRAPYEFIGVACAPASGSATSVVDGLVLLVVQADQVEEPAYLLSDGRPVQGDGWPFAMTDGEAAACRAAVGLPPEVPRPALGRLVLADLTDATAEADVIEVTTDTGWQWAGEAHLASGDVGQIALFPDSTEIVVRALRDVNEVVDEYVVPLGDSTTQAVAAAGCFELLISLQADHTGSARTQSCAA